MSVPRDTNGACAPACGLPPQAARLFRVLADPARLELLRLLSAGPLPCREIGRRLDWPAARVAGALASLRALGLVERDDAGGTAGYRIAAAVPAWLDELARRATLGVSRNSNLSDLLLRHAGR